MEMMKLFYYLWNIKLDLRSINKHCRNICSVRKKNLLTQEVFSLLNSTDWIDRFSFVVNKK